MEKSLIYRTVAFVAGFVLMTFELVAARLLAPTIGTSIFVWTNVLGVIMAALALGYWLGGRLADKRKEELDIVWLLVSVAATIIFVLVAGDGIVTIGLRLFSDAR
ncbi:fused MFS/spermidine synthase, partial [Candidatus Saccharibacteria bacterium]|nr:fused MFS/spermidine synthase [Candidatus Saccharibacteria bacterium]